jgi:hypothetical protein
MREGRMMKKCCEYGEDLKFWESYFHPTLDKNEQVCRQCFSFIEESMESYSNFMSKENSNKSDQFRDMV